ncbi:MAG: tRNA (adenosine(37)-N6)-threonylcarbamoyltransferase complex dimerization subunit type 1 TsaB [Lewinellaceae bacterium]|nr:tRNA (adenosine(37)-N6)-threonylcarbamoyltransferase complex dimerization subunit type 1 TsaB [Lewinellaceae bacterium]MCB9286043.1 tRNA (adenosine(37)-N6)-threonylcarbamoyltransferase complex dimerization subunit type 1 TsaB [Lewinellaceae bacterium]
MSLILHIETATDICSIGLSRGSRLLSLQNATAGYQHAAQITLLIQRCLEEAGVLMKELDALSLSSGPGSYTSLRVGAATAKGICYTLDKPLIVVDTLQSLALASLKQEREEALYYPMIDARRMEVYTAGFDAANEQIEGPQALAVDKSTFSEQLKAGHRVVLSGNGAEKCRAVLPSENIIFSPVACSAAHLLPLALVAFEQEKFEDVAYYSPFYLKPPNITTPKSRLK